MEQSMECCLGKDRPLFGASYETHDGPTIGALNESHLTLHLAAPMHLVIIEIEMVRLGVGGKGQLYTIVLQNSLMCSTKVFMQYYL